MKAAQAVASTWRVGPVGFLESRMWIRYDGDVLRVEVHDSGGGEPCVADEADEGGRGLLLVAALADKWGRILSVR